MAARGRGQAPPLRSILAGRCLPQQTSVGADAHIGPHLRATGQLRAGVGTRPYRPGPFAVCWCPAPCFPVGADAHIGPPLRPGAESGRGQAPPLRPSDARQPAGNEIPNVGAAKTVLETAETFGRFFRLIDSRGKFKVSLRTCHCFVMPSPAACGTMVNAIQSPIFREEQT